MPDIVQINSGSIPPYSIPAYIVNGDTTGNINAAAAQGWFPLPQRPCSVAIQAILAALGSPIGLFVFEVTADVNPLTNPILTPTALTLATAATALQPTDGLARNSWFEFNPAPSSFWMRMRYARTSGGSAAAGAFMAGLNVRML